jgi:hypothetical protein
MTYTIFKIKHGENARWYARPLEKGDLAPYPLIYFGRNARTRACRRAIELNEKEGIPALAA